MDSRIQRIMLPVREKIIDYLLIIFLKINNLSIIERK